MCGCVRQIYAVATVSEYDYLIGCTAWRANQPKPVFAEVEEEDGEEKGSRE